MAAVIANEFTEAASDLHISALIEIGLVLFIVTFVINAASRALIWGMTHQRKRAKSPAAKTVEKAA
jgi:phosphate transport system permease protein